MADFESGVSSYIHAKATIFVHFPVDFKGNEHICCEQCFYYRDGSKTCGLTKLPVLLPNKYVGHECPLERIEEESDERKDVSPSEG